MDEIQIKEQIKSENILKGGASWFIWIALLSIINSILILFFEGKFGFIIGLGITQLLDNVLLALYNNNLDPLMKLIAFTADLIIFLFFVLIAYKAGKKSKIWFMIGIIIYSIDSLLFLFFKDWLSLAFHFLALFAIINGYQQIQKLEKFKMEINTNKVIDANNETISTNHSDPDRLQEKIETKE